MPAKRYLVSGVVQGVGYRFYTEKAARAHGIGGWVRNLPDGRVEVMAEAGEGALAAFRSDLERGPGGARVDTVEEHGANPGGFGSSFTIRG